MCPDKCAIPDDFQEGAAKAVKSKKAANSDTTVDTVPMGVEEPAAEPEPEAGAVVKPTTPTAAPTPVRLYSPEELIASAIPRQRTIPRTPLPESATKPALFKLPAKFLCENCSDGYSPKDLLDYLTLDRGGTKRNASVDMFAVQRERMRKK